MPQRLVVAMTVSFGPGMSSHGAVTTRLVVYKTAALPTELHRREIPSMVADPPTHRVSVQPAQVDVGGLGGLDADAAVDGQNAVRAGDDGA